MPLVALDENKIRPTACEGSLDRVSNLVVGLLLQLHTTIPLHDQQTVLWIMIAIPYRLLYTTCFDVAPTMEILYGLSCQDMSQILLLSDI